jgi:CheY-like chemotaxis protein
MKKLDILLLDEDEEEGLMVRDAFLQNEAVASFSIFSREAELLGYLLSRFPNGIINRSVVIILNLHIAAEGRFQVLEALKEHPLLRYIPVIVYSSSADQRLIAACYDKGANAFVPKAKSYDELQAIASALTRFYSSKSIQLAVFEDNRPLSS